MPDVRSGLTDGEGKPLASTDDVNTESGFRAAIAAKVGKGGQQAPQAPTAPAEWDPDKETVGDVKRAVASETTEPPNVQRGLEEGLPSQHELPATGYTAEERAEWRRAMDEALATPEQRRHQEQRRAEQYELSEVRQLRAEAGMAQLREAFDLEDVDTAAVLANQLGTIIPAEEVEDYLGSLQDEIDDAYGDEEAPDLASEILGRARDVTIARQQEKLSAEGAMKAALMAETQQRGAEVALEAWAKGEGLSPADPEDAAYIGAILRLDSVYTSEAHEPRNEIEAQIQEEGPWYTLDPVKQHERFNLLDSLEDEIDRVERIAMFKAEIVEASSGTVSEGLTTSASAAADLLAENNRMLAKLTGESAEWEHVIDPDRVRDRATRKGVHVPTVKQFKRDIMAADTGSVSDGLTMGGKRASASEIVNANQKRQRDVDEARGYRA